MILFNKFPVGSRSGRFWSVAVINNSAMTHLVYILGFTLNVSICVCVCSGILGICIYGGISGSFHCVLIAKY